MFGFNIKKSPYYSNFSAQHALRLASFGNLFKILGIPPLETIEASQKPAEWEKLREKKTEHIFIALGYFRQKKISQQKPRHKNGISFFKNKKIPS